MVKTWSSWKTCKFSKVSKFWEVTWRMMGFPHLVSGEDHLQSESHEKAMKSGHFGRGSNCT